MKLVSDIYYINSPVFYKKIQMLKAKKYKPEVGKTITNSCGEEIKGGCRNITEFHNLN